MLLFTVAALCSTSGWTQYTEIATEFKRLSPREERNLREVLAEPVPSNATFLSLRNHFADKNTAAIRLGDERAREVMLRQATQHLPDVTWMVELGAVLLARGEIAEGNRYRGYAEANAPNSETRALYMAFIALDYAQQLDDDAARRKLRQMRARVASNKVGSSRWMPFRVLDERALSHGAMAESILEQHAGRHDAGIRLALEAEDHARSAWRLLASFTDPSRNAVANEIGQTVSRRLDAQRAGRRYEDAERTLNDYVRVSREFELSPLQQADLYLRASEIRFDKRDFSDAADLARKSDAVLAQRGLDETHPARLDRARALLLALVGQRSSIEASKLLAAIDARSADDEALKMRTVLPLERGLVYLTTAREAEAAALFERFAAETARLHGPEHFFTAQALGLQGVALWRSAAKPQREAALPLLQTAMQHMMAAVNADHVERIGMRLDLRDLIAEAYLEAAGASGTDASLVPLQIADWMATGVVREALEDAAARSAAATPELVALVRRDQQLRNEMRALRKYLDGTGGAIDTLLPALAEKTRSRIGEIDAQRHRLQAGIKERFPDYEQRLRPRPAESGDVAIRLRDDEALVALLQLERAVYVWAVDSEGTTTFHRAALDRGQLGLLVRRLRRTLDFNEMEGVLRPFDRAAAAELHARLLAPLDAVLGEKKHLIIVNPGILGEIPFGVLVTTQASGAAGRATPWLIRKAAISHEPSISAWLALRSAPPVASDQEALMAWGDPKFNRASRSPARGATATLADAGALGQRRSVFARRAVALGVDLDDSAAVARYAEIPPLPETGDELRAIAGVLRANPASDLKLGAAATRESVLAASEAGLLARKRVVAFATHGLMAGDLPLLTQPALALAATGEEGKRPLAPLLTLEDVMSLKLNADWVILSACNTAASDGSAAEALSGLARGFFYAGARSVLATHWAVESDSARLLTTATFAHYTQHPTARKSESLRQAMLGVMAMPAYEHPAFWAPYALVGDGGR